MSVQAAQAGLIVAVLDLKLVQSVTRAIRLADLESAAARKTPPPTIVHDRVTVSRSEVRERPSPCHDQRVPLRSVPGDARCRPCCRSAYRVWREQVACDAPMQPIIEVRKPELEAPLQPPWRTLPWQEPPRVPPKVKIVLHQPDIRHKGTLLDCFV